MSVFTKNLVSHRGGDPSVTARSIREVATQPIWGVWAGLFGLANNELIVVTVSDDGDENRWPDDVVVENREQLVATVRPTSDLQLTREGLYVFRSFHLDAANIDRVVELSQLAWRTFETSDAYDSEPIGLFAPPERGPDATMYLLTWYDDLTSWQTSRASDPQARAYFAQRGALMYSTTAVATRLLV